ncbi:unnamed protein product [Brassica oleracea var. botrytis]
MERRSEAICELLKILWCLPYKLDRKEVKGLEELLQHSPEVFEEQAHCRLLELHVSRLREFGVLVCRDFPGGTQGTRGLGED